MTTSRNLETVSVKSPGVDANSQRAHLPYLDGWRGIAILLVLLGHFFSIRGLSVQRFGVELFFVLSGRLMADILFVKNCELSKFYRRRISRIIPAFMLFVTVIACIPSKVPTLPVTWTDYFLAITFTANYAPRVWQEASISFGHLWSLCVEEHAYIILSIVALIVRKYNLRCSLILTPIIMLSICIGIVDSQFLHHTDHEVYWRTDVRSASIFISVVVFVELAPKLWILCHKAAILRLAPIAFGLLGTLLNLNALPDFVKYSAGTFCLACAVCTLDVAPPIVKRGLSLGALRFIGLISFSLYLWQQPLFGLYIAHEASRWFLIPLAFIIAVVSFFFIERPCRDLLNGRRLRVREKAVVVARPNLLSSPMRRHS